MLQTTKNRKQGFTLIELAIVLTIAGLLFVGLWRLLAGGNSQIRDQSVANEQQQLISAVKGYLAANPDNWLQTVPTSPGTLNLPLPTTFAGCVGAPAGGGLCNFLPSGFIRTTPNAYGQNYTIQVIRNDTTALNTLPTSYSFMIVTTIGDTIPDSSGGRISAAIGNDGGFIYTGAVCTVQTGQTAPNSACGAYGTWSSSTGAYGLLGATASGHIASRTFVSPTSDNLSPWLERNTTIQPDPTFGWNTMTTDLYMGGNTKQPVGAPLANYGSIYLAPPAASAAFVAGNASGNIFLSAPGTTTAGGTIFMEGGLISGAGLSQISMAADGTTVNSLIKVTTTGNGNCPMTSPGISAACPWGISTDSITVSGLANANAFYAQNFNYTASDIRFKTNIHPLNDSLENLMKVRPVSYKLKSSDKEDMGLLAQDLEKVYPQLVSQGGDMKYVSYDGLIAPLIGAVQELKKENEQLQQQLHEQELRQDELEKKIRVLSPTGKN